MDQKADVNLWLSRGRPMRLFEAVTVAAAKKAAVGNSG
jgi:hypothetical protein